MTNDKKHNEFITATPEEALEPLGGEPSKDDGSARRKLIESSVTLFAQNGLEGTSTRDIAKAAGVNISLIAYHFGGKEGLYKAVFYEFAMQASAELSGHLEAIDVSKLTKEKFCLFMKGFISVITHKKFNSPDLSMLFQREMIAGMPHAREIYETVFNKMLETVVNLFKEGQAKGFVKKDINPYVVFLSLVHSTDCYMHVNKCEHLIHGSIPHLPAQMKQYQEQIYKIFIEGILV